MKLTRSLITLALAGTLSACASTGSSIQPKTITYKSNPWFGMMEKELAKSQQQFTQIKSKKGAAKNIILFVGDGMGVSTITASRILEGQMRGESGEENNLAFDNFPFSGLVKTYNVDAQTPDSAGTMTAMMSGVKTDAGVIGVSAEVQRGECKTASGNELGTALELAEIAGKSTGIVSTARITHATPAATYAKSVERNWEAKAKGGCEDIASQLVEFEENLEYEFDGVDVDGLEVVMGGGRRNFLPQGKGSKRKDNRNLINEWKTAYPDGQYIENQAQFDAINPETTKHLFGLFNASHMQYESDRKNDSDGGEPSLSEMTNKAIKILDNNDKGFLLVVESGRIDHAHHAGNAYNALKDTIEFSNAVKTAVANTNPDETLILVTADHSHVFTIAGYPRRGNPILGKVVGVGKTKPDLAADKKPYTTLGYTNGRGFQNLGGETNADASYKQPINAGRKDITNIDTTTPGYHQEALIPRKSETHAGEDVALYGKGPGAHLVTGTNEQSLVFHIMNHAGNLDGLAQEAMSK